jgi:hypothetical protein
MLMKSRTRLIWTFYDNGSEDNIFEEFIQVLTNVADNKSSERAREQVHHL